MSPNSGAAITPPEILSNGELVGFLMATNNATFGSFVGANPIKEEINLFGSYPP
jgi:hypothetical protein